MKFLEIALCAPLCFLLPTAEAHADNGTETSACKTAIAAIVRKTNARVDHPSPSGDNMFFAHPAAGDIVLFCGALTPLGLSASVDTGYPSQAFYRFLGAAGSVIVGVEPDSLQEAVIDCQTSALKSQDETSQMAAGSGSLECQAFTRDGGGTTIGINAK